jgi:hypothetical protein
MRVGRIDLNPPERVEVDAFHLRHSTIPGRLVPLSAA